MRESKRAIERERERESFQNRKPYLMKVHGLEAHPLLSRSKRKQKIVCNQMTYLP